MSRFKRRFRRSREADSEDSSHKRHNFNPSSAAEAVSDDDGSEGKGPRVHVPKLKYAIAFGYLGLAYHGYQVQGGSHKDQVDTVEGRLLEALFAAGAIHESHRGVMSKIQLSKASRTDKGVHAACTYMGGRFELSHLSSGEPGIPREEALVSKLNELLPGDIRCYRVLRVTRGFCARSMCSKRSYEYVIPNWLLRKKYVLDDVKREQFSELSAKMECHLKSPAYISCIRQGPSDGYEGTTEEREIDLELLQAILNDYCGTHDFRNFTPRHKSTDNTTQRFIHEIKVERRSVEGCSDEILSLMITGQSFLYNQIRKMVSLAYEVYLGTAPRNAIKFALSKRHAVQTGIAPAEGLFLHHPYFDAYNKRCNPPQTPMIEYDDIAHLAEDFKTRQVYPAIVESFRGDVWSTWLARFILHPFFLENQEFSVSGDKSTPGGVPEPVAQYDAEPA